MKKEFIIKTLKIIIIVAIIFDLWPICYALAKQVGINTYQEKENISYENFKVQGLESQLFTHKIYAQITEIKSKNLIQVKGLNVNASNYRRDFLVYTSNITIVNDTETDFSSLQTDDIISIIYLDRYIVDEEICKIKNVYEIKVLSK